MSDSLVAAGNLDVTFTEHIYIPEETLHEAIDCSLEVLKVLVHKTQV